MRVVIENCYPPCCGFKQGGCGHAWVIDGYATLYQTYRVRKAGWRPGDGNGDGIMGWIRDVWEENEYKDPVFLFHCNWGWGGDSNGYFYPGVFNTSNPILRDPGASGTQYNNFDTNIQMFKYKMPR